MCYDISFTISLRKLSDYFPGLVFDEQLEMKFGPVHIIGHNYGEHPVIYRKKEDGKLHCMLMQWGCIPFYVKDEKAFARQRATMLNARSERVFNDTKSYWYKIRNRRCLIPVTGFYEHREVKNFKKKIPYYIGLKEQPVFYLPGLYSVAELLDKETGEIKKVFTFTILTTIANNIMLQIHNGGENAGRMPLILPFQKSMQWLEQNLTDEHYKEILNIQHPSQYLDFKTVYTIRSNKERPDEKQKNEFWEWEGVPCIEA